MGRLCRISDSRSLMTGGRHHLGRKQEDFMSRLDHMDRERGEGLHIAPVHIRTVLGPVASVMEWQRVDPNHAQSLAAAG